MLVRALIVLFSVLNLGAAVWWIAHDPPAPAVAAQVPAGVARLQLVDERANVPAATPAPAPAQAAATATTSPMVPEAPAAQAPPATTDDITAPPAQQCFSFGPFATAEAGTAAAAKLRPLVQKLTTREQAAPATPARGWRVYLPPLPSPEQAQAVAQRIGAAGFDDFLIVREGAETNSIALGLYRNEEGAKKRANALVAAGFAAQVEALGESAAGAATRVWLDVIADEAFDPRRAQATISAAQYRKADCPAR